MVSLLLRLLLCLALATNGVALAHVAVPVHAVETAAEAGAPMPAGGGCHGSALEAPPAAAPSGDGIATDEAPAPTGCCDADSCRCPCAVPASLMPVSGVRSGPTPACIDATAAGTPRHRPPRLAHLIRPPIG